MLWIALLAIPALAQWQRQVSTPKSWFVDSPAPHPLSYFTQYPSLRDEDHNFCYLCLPEKSLAAAKLRNDRAEVKLVGRIRGLEIYDVFYSFEGESAEPDWKSILVRVQPGQYREIWHYQRTEGRIWPSHLVRVGNETLLGLMDDCYRQDIVQEIFWFGKNGPVSVDFSPVWKAAEAVVPKDTTVWPRYDGRTDLPAGRIDVGMFTEPAWRCCTAGVVEVRFELSNGRVVIKSSRLDPTAEYKWRGCR